MVTELYGGRSGNLAQSAGRSPGPVGIYSFTDWHRVMAFAALFVLPIVLLFVVLQRQIVSGLTTGALK